MLSKILNYYFELKYTLFVYQEIALKLKTNAKIPELKSFFLSSGIQEKYKV